MNGLHVYSRAQIRKSIARTLIHGQILPKRKMLVPGEFGDVPGFVPSLTTIPGRMRAVKSDEVPDRLKQEVRNLFAVSIFSDQTFRTAIGGPIFKVSEGDRLSVEGTDYDVLAVLVDANGKGFLSYAYVAKVIADA